MPSLPPRSPLLEAWARERDREPARVCVIDARGAHTFPSLDARARAVARALLDGAASLSGERVAILAAPGADFVAALFGVLLAGGCAVVLSPLHPTPESAYFCEHSRVHTLLVSREHVARAEPLREGRRLLDLGELDATSPRLEGHLEAPRASDDAALQLYTSGTTGKPKGAVITHANLAVQQRLLGDAWAMSERDVLLHALPLHHMHGLAIALLNAIGAGAATRMLPAFVAAEVWEEMARASVLMAVPTMYSRLVAAYEAADATTRGRWSACARALRIATSGSASLPVGLASAWRAIAGDVPVERFGMTEIGVGTTNPIDGPRRPGFVGRPLHSVETRVVDGELWVRGPSVFSGYFADEAATRAAFADDPDGGAPWFKTGDTVAIDEDGSFKILGRTSVDILKSGGYKISALEIEEALREHPAVSEVAVIGLPDEAWGERVVACVVAREGREAEASEEALRAFAKAILAPYKVPKQVVLLAELPKNAIGKVMKPELARRVVEGRAASG